MIKKFNPELIYIKGEHNIIAYVLSKLTSLSEEVLEDNNQTYFMNKYYGNEPKKLLKSAFPLYLKDIQCYQQEDKQLKDKLQYNKKNSLTPYHGGGKS